MLKKITLVFAASAVLVISVNAFFAYSKPIDTDFIDTTETSNKHVVSLDQDGNPIIAEKLHIEKPEHVKGVYMSSWVAGTQSVRDRLTKLVEETEINSIVIDFKDSSGVVSIPAKETDSVDRKNAASRRAPQLANYINELHAKDIYVIARIAVFEDPIYATHNANEAVQLEGGILWKDRHGLAWVDPGSTQFHAYILNLANEAYDLGFDEINFDYIRYPTDGVGKKIFPISGNVNQDVITGFLGHMYKELSAKEIPVSIDVFGQIVTDKTHMGIGQHYESLLAVTDAICPMVYPSHFYPGYHNLKSPESSPYETIRLSLADALFRRNAINSKTEIRPWIQDFSLSVTYGPKEVEAQIQAAKDLGIHSWILWDPKNRYTKEALLDS